MTPKEKISKAIREPTGAPKTLVESMVTTVKAIEKGREAEKGLKALGNTASKNDVRDLAAVAAIGRLAQNNRLPAGTDVEALVTQMKELPIFEALTDRSPEEIGHDLDNGKFTDDLSRVAENELSNVGLAPATVSEPELDVPEKQAPMM